MVSLSLRSHRVPTNAILIQSDTHKPLGYANETSLFGKFIKGVANNCTNPGTCVGASTHTHCSAGCHTHTPGSSAHTHSFITGNQSVTCTTSGGGGSVSAEVHTHSKTSDSASPATTITNNDSHAHDAQNNNPSHKTVFYLKHNETTIGLRRRNLGLGSYFMWGKPSACLPSRYSLSSNYNCKHIKGVAGACCSPNACGGSNTHIHSGNSAHNHTVSIPTHTHSLTGSTGGPSLTDCHGTGARVIAAGTHTHTMNTITIGCGSGNSGATTNSSTHTHDCLSIEPSYKTVGFVKINTIGLRNFGIIKGGLLVWLCTAASVPSKFRGSDGACGTVDLRSLYPKGHATPGGTGGSCTHTHNSQGGAHNHCGSKSLCHTHTISGVSGCVSNTVTTTASGVGVVGDNTHTHTPPANSTNANVVITIGCTSNAHTHGSKNHQPVTKTVMFIERL